jgi:tRNA A-37 threonylcarbamoyl transferase component Bud32
VRLQFNVMPSAAETADGNAASRWIWSNGVGARWQINRAFASPAFMERLGVPETLFAAPAEPLKRDPVPRSTYLVRAHLPEHPTTFIIKRYRSKNLWDSVKDLFRPSRARRAFERAFLLQQHNIPTATPIAAGEKRCCRWLRESYLISAEIPNVCTLWDAKRTTKDPRQTRLFVRELAATMARLHDAGFSHSDPNLANFLVCGDDGRSPRLVVIDLDNVRPCRRVSLRRAAKDLRRLLRVRISPRERLWFVAQYCRARARRLRARQVISLLDERAPADVPPSSK